MDKCIFFQNKHCKALKVTECEGGQCAFFKTEKQFYEGMKKAEERLQSLGLKPVEVFLPAIHIMTTKKTKGDEK